MHAFFEYFCGIKLWELKHYKLGAPPGGISVSKVFEASPLAEARTAAVTTSPTFRRACHRRGRPEKNTGNP